MGNVPVSSMLTHFDKTPAIKKKELFCWNLQHESDVFIELNPNSEVGWNDFYFPRRPPSLHRRSAGATVVHNSVITRSHNYHESVVSTPAGCCVTGPPKHHKRSSRSHSSCHLSALALIQAPKFQPNAP